MNGGFSLMQRKGDNSSVLSVAIATQEMRLIKPSLTRFSGDNTKK